MMEEGEEAEETGTKEVGRVWLMGNVRKVIETFGVITCEREKEKSKAPRKMTRTRNQNSSQVKLQLM